MTITSGLPATQHILLDVQGMKCGGCVRSVERHLRTYPGVLAVTVNLATRQAQVLGDVTQVIPEKLAQFLTQKGFPSRPHRLWDTPTLSLNQASWQLILAVGLLLVSGLAHLPGGHHHWPWLHHPLTEWLLATVTLLLPGRGMLISGWQSWRTGAPTMYTLVGLGVTVAYIASTIAWLWPQLGWERFFQEVVMVVALMLVGQTLELRARQRAGRALQSLVALQPPTARLLSPQGVWEQVPLTQVRVGQVVRVEAGETLPVDGVIREGLTLVDAAMLTGESLPVTQKPGDQVYSGTVNLTDAVMVEVTATGGATRLGQIIHLVLTAQTRKAPVQGIADRVAGWFTYGVMGIAGVTLLFWGLVAPWFWPDLGHPWLVAVHRLTAVLVVACPCALGLATPMAILVGLTRGAQRGLLIRGGDILEQVAPVDWLVFDKTGTLTQGHPQVAQVQLLAPHPVVDNSQELWQLAAQLEWGSTHPLAVGIRQSAPLTQRTWQINGIHLEPGVGVTAQVDGYPVTLGRWPMDNPLPIALEPGQTVVAFQVGGKPVGVLHLQDQVRPEAAAVVQELQAQGIQVRVLSGDRPEVVQHLAQTLGLRSDQVQGGLFPADKVAWVTQWQNQGQRVAVVGDGSNDAPALVAAHVGMAMAQGTQVALESAGIVLIHNNLRDVVAALTLSRRTLAKIYQNLAWAFLYNVIAIPLAAGVFLPWGWALTPTLAAGLMAGSSLGVILNSLTLRPPAPSP
ncbi:heavy metal translocating P-type ATPase [Gloeomargarita lithophora Alchichica-D10]|uniref:Heavy metal translocating P-type ATPase n=1 Tax=Gloeomargarita lithophora Alchichica-D10 TaxID=1188229 RepID=A0A1J0AA66_9CYAN|nr:cation-translocating P-type ATPase [Gloeomargarita lithophora]APB32826.1 heavy metal translocating P-type ATPase [Gloeomargarita lithophora Alchichica-D10]